LIKNPSPVAERDAERRAVRDAQNETKTLSALSLQQKLDGSCINSNPISRPTLIRHENLAGKLTSVRRDTQARVTAIQLVAHEVMAESRENCSELSNAL